MLAYEMALRFCESDGALSEGEKEFLCDLQAHLRLNAAEAPNHTTVVPTYPLVRANNPYLVASHPLPPANPGKGQVHPTFLDPANGHWFESALIPDTSEKGGGAPRSANLSLLDSCFE